MAKVWYCVLGVRLGKLSIHHISGKVELQPHRTVILGTAVHHLMLASGLQSKKIPNYDENNNKTLTITTTMNKINNNNNNPYNTQYNQD